MFRDRFWITLALTIPTLVWSEMIQGWFGFRAPAFTGSRYIPAVFGTAVYFYGGWVFLAGGVRELRDRLPGMMTLISLAISVAFVFSVAVTLGYPGDALWWELATLVAIMLLGHWIEMRSIFQASGALRELARLLPSTAQRVVGDRVEEVPISVLGEGDLVLVRPGASIPADGVVQNGKSDVNESMITGESAPVPKAEGAKVIAGTVNGSGSLRVQVTGTGERTALANIMRLVEQAQTSRSRAQTLADRAAFLLTLIAIAAAIVTLIVWMALGAPGDVRYRARVSPCSSSRVLTRSVWRSAGHRHLDDPRRQLRVARPRSPWARGGPTPDEPSSSTRPAPSHAASSGSWTWRPTAASTRPKRSGSPPVLSETRNTRSRKASSRAQKNRT
jgi:Cu2+-exporting ATPase